MTKGLKNNAFTSRAVLLVLVCISGPGNKVHDDLVGAEAPANGADANLQQNLSRPDAQVASELQLGDAATHLTITETGKGARPCKLSVCVHLELFNRKQVSSV